MTVDVLALVRRVQLAAAATTRVVEVAYAKARYLQSGAPLVCGLCGAPIDACCQTWQVCAGWAEHTVCHHCDPAAEAEARARLIDACELDAHTEDTHRTHAQQQLVPRRDVDTDVTPGRGGYGITGP